MNETLILFPDYRLIIQKILTGIDVQFVIIFGILIVLDWLTGVVKAVKTKNFSSHEGIRGILYKLSVLLGFIAFAVANNIYLSINWLEEFFKLSLIFYEITSIFENIFIIEPKTKSFLTSILTKIGEKVNQYKEQKNATESKNEL